MPRRQFALAVVAIFLVATSLRAAWLTADPPSVGSVGIVWHDEGAWVHNARNRALWGAWRTDNWNPVFIAPVFTALEYESFRAFGVGTWQARVVPAVSGIVAIAFLIAGLAVVAGRRAAAMGGLLLAVNYAYVMWNRAALMESTMTAFIVMAWSAYALSAKRPAWAFIAGAAAVGAFFTKASAAFFVAALALEAVWSLSALWFTARSQPTGPLKDRMWSRDRRRWIAEPGALTLIGIGAAALAVLTWFVWPNWREYQFYNWQMTVTRKPSYGVKDFIDRASWLPVAQGLFSRMWGTIAVGGVGLLAIIGGWRTAKPAERLLVLWVLVGLAELVVHDSGNERRYVMFVPAFIALASVFVGGPRRDDSEHHDSIARSLPNDSIARPVGHDPITRVVVGLAAVPVFYLIAGSGLRPLFLSAVLAGDYHQIVRVSAAGALVLAALTFWRWPALSSWIDRTTISTPLLVSGLVATLVWNGYEFSQWAERRTALNYAASTALGQLLPDGTWVQGKLANGLSLENRIRPIFVGNGFGNYDDRLRRDDARYILTYDLPRIGYESDPGSGLIQGILDHYPERREVATFEVDETPEPDRAALFDKFPDQPPPHARDSQRPH